MTVYLIKEQAPVHGITRMHLIKKGFACAPCELRREITTYCKNVLNVTNITDLQTYGSYEGARIVGQAHNDEFCGGIKC